MGTGGSRDITTGSDAQDPIGSDKSRRAQHRTSINRAVSIVSYGWVSVDLNRLFVPLPSAPVGTHQVTSGLISISGGRVRAHGAPSNGSARKNDQDGRWEPFLRELQMAQEASSKTARPPTRASRGPKRPSRRPQDRPIRFQEDPMSAPGRPLTIAADS